jgi:hypothetical protein
LIPRTILNDAHSNVPITTTNIIPNKAANSTISSKGAANKIKPSSTKAAVIPDKRQLINKGVLTLPSRGLTSGAASAPTFYRFISAHWVSL